MAKLIDHVVWATGFRPFFVGAAVLALIWPLVWILVLFNQLGLMSWLGPVGWHAHEMIFGFTAAVLAGFLLTATEAWTKLQTAKRVPLLLLALLWLAARLGLLLPRAFAPLAVPVDVAFLPALAWFCGRPVVRARNWRNLAFAPLLVLMGLCNLALHLEGLGWLVGWRLAAQSVALYCVLLMIAIVGGRIIPMFTRNAIDGLQVRERGWIDQAALCGLAVLLVAHAMPLPDSFLGSASLAVGGLQLLRMRGWGFWAAARRPFLAVLHVGYLWLPVGLVLCGAAQLGWTAAAGPGLHALTVGAIATLVIGMISRVALGHTGRPLRIGRAMAVGYLLLTLGALVRVFVPLVALPLYRPSLIVVTACWIGAFAIYLVRYLPILTSPRVDGKAG